MTHTPKIALVHDQLNQAGGAERVLLAMKALFPEAPIYTLLYEPEKLKGFESFDVRPSMIQKMPLAKSKFKWYLPIMPAAVEALDLSGYDIVISSTSALMKGIITGPQTKHICYCHTPTRYLWTDSSEYTETLNAPSFIKKLLPLYLTKLRTWDQLASQRVDAYIANSQCVSQRIKNFYHKDSHVIYPPVDVEKYTPSSELGDYYLMIGRLRPYKKFDLAIKAFNKLQRPLKIIGTGEQEAELKKMAGPHIEFLGSVDEQTKRDYLSKCLAFINPQVEDFGITSVEAMAAGRPVIAYRDGGAVEQLIEGVTGEFINDQTWQALVDMILHFDPHAYDPQTIHAHAQKFSTKNFLENLKNYITNV
jgi:glycosyltransferase involved in cell wall biosynthesis